MAEWFKRGTVNTFNRGSNPLKAYKLEIIFFNFLTKKKIRYHPTAFFFRLPSPFQDKNKKGKIYFKRVLYSILR